MNRKHLTRPAAIAVVALLVAGSLAYAAWTVNGSGPAPPPRPARSACR